ncbi:MAG TPA: hypothetical protein VGM88_05550 [Kofleriaceae bacterium]|jgi:hypothetical protein
MTRWAVLALMLAGGVAHGKAVAAPPDGYLARLAAGVRHELDALAEARKPPVTPPVPVAVKWRPVKVGSLDLGAPLVAMAAADLDGDGKGELYLVTTKEVIAVGLVGRAHELGRVAFAGEPAPLESRDVVGTAVVDGKTLVAGTSAWAKELRVSWSAGTKRTLVAKVGDAAFTLCPGVHASLAPGRNYFDTVAGPIYAARCRADLVNAQGQPLVARAELALTGKLAVAVEGATEKLSAEVAASGTAFELADIDRDGQVEIIASEASAPGDADAVRVFSLADTKKPLFRKSFAGGVAGIAAVDGDGDGVAEVIAAVRLVGATRVDLWRLD